VSEEVDIVKFGQFCGLLADELSFHHSSFLLSAELLFSSAEAAEVLDASFILPRRAVTGRDAALLLCLAVAMDRGFSDPSEISEYARDVVGVGSNLNKVADAIEQGMGVSLDLSGQFGSTITIPGWLIEKIAPVVKGGIISHLRSI
jgi:hypothetical protein